MQEFDAIRNLLDQFIGNGNYEITGNGKILVKSAITDIDVFVALLGLVKSINKDAKIFGSWKNGTYFRKGYWLILDTKPNGGFVPKPNEDTKETVGDIS